MAQLKQQPAIQHFDEVKLTFPSPITLANGIKVWVIGNGEDEVNQLTVYVKGGIFHQASPAIADLVARLCTQGNQHMSASQIAETLDYCGAWRSGMAHEQCTTITMSSLNRNFEKTLNIVFNSIDNPSFPEEEFNLCCQRYASSIETSRKKVKTLAIEETKRLYYGSRHPLAQIIEPTHVLKLTPTQLQAFHSVHFNTSNCHMMIAGKVGDKQLKLIDDTFGSWHKAGEPTLPAKPAIKPSPLMLSLVHLDGAIQSAISITIPAVGRLHPHYLKLRLLVTAFGGYFGSRLNANIREDKGYTYGIAARLLGRDDEAHISISTECATQYTGLIIEEIKKEMLNLQQEPMSLEELNMVKQYMLSEQMKIFDSPFHIASYVHSTFLYGIYPDYFNRQLNVIKNTTAQELQHLATLYLRPQLMRIVVAGNQEKIEKLNTFK